MNIRTKTFWLVFLCALLLPPILTLLSAVTMRSTLLNPVDETVSPYLGLIGGGIGGLICGVMLGCGFTKSIPGRVILSIVLSAIMIVVCVGLCLVGCTTGGYRFSLSE